MVTAFVEMKMFAAISVAVRAGPQHQRAVLQNRAPANEILP